MGRVKDANELHLRDPEHFGERIEQALASAKAWLDIAESDSRERAREAWSACEELAMAPDILGRLEDHLRRSGLAGEVRVAKVLYLAVTSRLLERMVSVAVKGPSSGGKSHLVERVLSLFPPSAYYALTAMSERALVYSEEPISHRFLVVYEAAGMNGDLLTYFLRSLLSEGRLRYEAVEKTAEGMRPRLIERDGPTGLIVTTTSVKLHPENETRMLSLHVTDTQEQTRAVLEAIAAEDHETPDAGPWLALQVWLEVSDHEVTVPYAHVLARAIPPVAVRLRRDFATLLGLVRAHAVLHQATRQRDGRGRIVASHEDYAAVRALVADLMADGAESTVPRTVRETVEAIGRLLRDPGGEDNDAEKVVTTAEVAKELWLDKSTAWRRVREAVNRGHVKNLEDRKARPARLVLADPLPEDVEVLPPVERLHDCVVAGDPGGKVLPPPPSAAGNEPENLSDLKQSLEGLEF